jgi:hypothetical protein
VVTPAENRMRGYSTVLKFFLSNAVVLTLNSLSSSNDPFWALTAVSGVTRGMERNPSARGMEHSHCVLQCLTILAVEAAAASSKHSCTSDECV